MTTFLPETRGRFCCESSSAESLNPREEKGCPWKVVIARTQNGGGLPCRGRVEIRGSVSPPETDIRRGNKSSLAERHIAPEGARASGKRRTPDYVCIPGARASPGAADPLGRALVNSQLTRFRVINRAKTSNRLCSRIRGCRGFPWHEFHRSFLPAPPPGTCAPPGCRFFLSPRPEICSLQLQAATGTQPCDRGGSGAGVR